MTGWTAAALGVVLAISSVGFVWGFYEPRLERWAGAGFGLSWGFAALELWQWVAGGHGWPGGGPAVTATLVVWMAATGFPVWARRPGWAPLAGFAVPVLTVVWLASQVAPAGPAGSPPVLLAGAWVHLGLSALALTLLLLGAAAAGMYLEHERELLHKTPRLFYYRLPPLGDLDRWSYRLSLAGWAALAGTLAAERWMLGPSGVYWMQSVSVLGALGVWAALGVELALWARGWRGHRAAWVTVAALVALVADLVGTGGVAAHSAGMAAWHRLGG